MLTTMRRLCSAICTAPEPRSKDPCEGADCWNGGTCIPVEEGYLCQCPPGVRGTSCQTSTSSLCVSLLNSLLSIDMVVCSWGDVMYFPLIRRRLLILRTDRVQIRNWNIVWLTINWGVVIPWSNVIIFYMPLYLASSWINRGLSLELTHINGSTYNLQVCIL